MAIGARYIAFLRAINVGGHTVKMDDLRRLFKRFGFSNVETFIASGNVVFESQISDTTTLERVIETGLRKALGYEVATFTRTDVELAAMAAYQPFSPERLSQAKALNVGILAAPIDAGAARRLMALRTDVDDFRVHGREVYWLCRERQSDSSFSNATFEKAVGVRVTFRSVTTVRKLAAKYAPRPS